MHELGAKLFLIARRNVTHGGDLTAGPQNLLRIAVALETPAHLKAIGLPHERHLIHTSVAAFAADSLIDVNAVVEIHKVRQIVHARPSQGIARAVTGADRFQRGAGVPDLRMAIDAGLGGRNISEAGFLHGSVAIAAIEAEGADMVGVAERHGLIARLFLARLIRPAVQLIAGPCDEADGADAEDDRHPRIIVRAVMENLGHGFKRLQARRSDFYLVAFQEESNP